MPVTTTTTTTSPTPPTFDPAGDPDCVQVGEGWQCVKDDGATVITIKPCKCCEKCNPCEICNVPFCCSGDVSLAIEFPSIFDGSLVTIDQHVFPSGDACGILNGFDFDEGGRWCDSCDNQPPDDSGDWEIIAMSVNNGGLIFRSGFEEGDDPSCGLWLFWFLRFDIVVTWRNSVTGQIVQRGQDCIYTGCEKLDEEFRCITVDDLNTVFPTICQTRLIFSCEGSENLVAQAVSHTWSPDPLNDGFQVSNTGESRPNGVGDWLDTLTPFKSCKRCRATKYEMNRAGPNSVMENLDEWVERCYQNAINHPSIIARTTAKIAPQISRDQLREWIIESCELSVR